MKTLRFLYTFVTIFVTLLFANNINAQCTHTFTGYDSYGDGWNGAYCTVTVNGQVVGLVELLTGSSESLQFQANDGDLIKLDWVSGSWDSEISWDCTDGGGNTIAMGVYGETNVGVGACPAAIVCAPLDYSQNFESGTTQMTATTGAGSIIAIDAASANSSTYGLHLQGNTYTGWSSAYSTGPDAFNNSPSDTTSAPDPNLPNSVKIETFELDFTEKQTRGLTFLK